MRGSKRNKKMLPNKFAEQAFIHMCIVKNGGPNKIGKCLGITGEAINNWRRRGYVPVPGGYVHAAARLFNVPKEALNNRYRSALGTHIISWAAAINKVSWLSPEVKNALLSMPKKFDK